jgi:hypothetical protein
VPFVFAADGQEFSTDDLTIDEVVVVEKAAGAGWYALNPLASAQHFRAILVEFYARTRSRDEAEKLVGALPLSQADRMCRFEAQDDRPDTYRDGVPVVDPKAEPDAPETT